MYVAQEHSIYGSSRVGVDNSKDTLYLGAVYTTTWGGVGTSRRELGLKSFELANHLGNVLVTVSDKPIYKVSSGTIYFQPEITSTSDYYPFGAPIAGRSAAFGNEYRFGFNGKEGDDEVNGEGNRQDYGMRMYDGRLGRAFSVDPLTGKFPELSPFQFFSNSPIANMDLDGLEAWPVTRQWNPPDIDGFAVYSMAAIKQMKSDKIKDDCANFALRLIVGYASQNGLPLTLTNTANRTFDASSTKYSTPTQYLNDVRVNIQAKDLVRNTYGVDQADQQPGDLEIMHYTLHNSKKVNFDHVVIISNNIGSIVYGNLYPDGSGEILAGPFNNWTHDTRTNDGVKNKWTMYHGKMSSRWNVLNPATMTPVVTNTPAITDTTTTPQSP
jgi:RHS repeat-associated protein